MSGPLLPEDEAKLRAERYVREELERDDDEIRMTIDMLDSAVARMGERFKEARKTLFAQQQADRNALADRCAGKGVAEIDRLFQQQAEVHYQQASNASAAHIKAYEAIARQAEQIERETRSQQGLSRDEQGRGR
jgi:uncharacterized protein YukE